MTRYSRFLNRIGRKIMWAQLADAHDPREYAEITIDYLRRMATRHRPNDAAAINDFLDFVEGK